jgi:glycosyltransferase involved in cell wall biosynthesis
MKILQANKYYYLKGGAERHLFDLKELLEENGHRIIPFAMQDDKNINSSYSKYFVSNINLEKSSFSLEGLRAAGRIIYSFEARSNIEKLIKEEKPDIAHIHNIYHQISPSILTPLKKAGIPIIMTVHDFKLMCPNYIFYTQGKICERCKKHRYYNCVLHKCVKNSYVASKVNMLEMYLHSFLKIYKNNIDLYISPSQFVKEKLVEFGFDSNKIEVLPHFLNSDISNPYAKSNNNKFKDFTENIKNHILPNNKNLPQNSEQIISSDDYILYFGRLSKEKGIKTLLKAIEKIKNKQIKLKLAGSGPQEKELKDYVAKNNLQGRIKFLGFLDGEKLSDTIHNSLFTVMPSVFYETFGLSVLESYNYGKSVIASNIGALPELVQEGKTGLLFESGNSNDLAQKIDNMLQNKENIMTMGKNGKEFSKKFNKEDYYNKLEKIYKRLSN